MSHSYPIVNRPVPRTGDYISAIGPQGQDIVVAIGAAQQLSPGGAVRRGENQAFFSGVVASAPDILLGQPVRGITIGADHGTVTARLLTTPEGRT